ncbi:MAG: rod shape-determining protein MreC [Planctomycetaceae bacterium]|nr:rod shape-determining protein MreC [Planctomycetaceae bacterium]
MPETVDKLAMPRSPAPFSLVCLIAALGAGMWFAPDEVTTRWRAAVRDGLTPGQAAVRLAAARAGEALERVVPRPAPQRELHDIQTRLASAERRNRRLEVQLAAWERQRNLIEGATDSHLVGESRNPLLVPQLVSARVLGNESAALWRSRTLIGAGTAAGVRESALVLDDQRPLVDQGTDADLATGDAIYAGRCVIGKIAEAGRYSSTIERITDAGFSGRARVARRTSRGLAFGPEGTLTGDGSDRCRLKHISEPVNVGDEVYTGGADGVLPYAMYYGKVVRAELEPGAADWSIDVQPAATLDEFGQVQILRLTLNPGRILAD